jgi:hypothetical protein
MNNDDGLWAELRAQVARYGPRYDPSVTGRCAICNQGPSMMVPLSGEPWAICGFCNRPWHVEGHPFDMPPDQDEDSYALCFNLIADAFAAHGDLRHEDFMKSKPTESVVEPGDPKHRTRAAEIAAGGHPARYELRVFAERLGYPRLQYTNLWGFPEWIEGRQQWSECGLASFDGRRDLWKQLVELEHNQQTAERNKR